MQAKVSKLDESFKEFRLGHYSAETNYFHNISFFF